MQTVGELIQNKINALIRADASSTLGAGHVMRCLVLADELKVKGWEVDFCCRQLQGNMISYIEARGYNVMCLPSQFSENNEIEYLLNTATLRDKYRLAVVDHYELGKVWEKACRKYSDLLMVIDDLGREHYCDLLLNQNLTLEVDRYLGKVPKECKLMLGVKYTLLRPMFLETRNKREYYSGDVKRIHVFFGSADPTNETIKALRAIRMLDSSEIKVDVLVGKQNRRKKEVELFCKNMENVELYCDVDRIDLLMIKSDIVIGACGSTTWERCCLGLPAIVIVTAENQIEVAKATGQYGVIRNLGWHAEVDVDAINKELRYCIGKPKELEGMSEKAKKLVEGYGAQKVCDEISAMALHGIFH